MKTFQVNCGNLVFTISYDEAEGTGTMSAAGRTAVISSDFAQGIENLSQASREDLLLTAFACRKEISAMLERILEREDTSLSTNQILKTLVGKVIH